MFLLTDNEELYMLMNMSATVIIILIYYLLLYESIQSSDKRQYTFNYINPIIDVLEHF